MSAYSNPYDQELHSYLNYHSMIVKVGDVPIGGNMPIVVQSMTNTFTMDTRATVEQTIQLAEAGCQVVRIAAQNIREAENLYSIKNELKKSGCKVPLVADIHYLPKAAEIAARIVEKVRINPGNYAENKIPGKEMFSDQEYSDEVHKIADRMLPLLKICKQYGTAIRIGTNHGSLSPRILSRYGDTPAGMVESALEFARICSANGFHNLILSMKSSNIRIMIQATRLLVSRMKAENMAYPLHLGVTEAGEGEDGRIKSAAGIGTLLEEGIGDTIRVSLTEDPVHEIPFAQKLVEPYNDGPQRKKSLATIPAFHPYQFEKRNSIASGKIGGGQVPVIIGSDVEHDAIERQDDILVFKAQSANYVDELRKYFKGLLDNNNPRPVILKIRYNDTQDERSLIKLTIKLACALTDGLGDGIWIKPDEQTNQAELTRLLLGILQATGSRISRTDYISCPSCGRTKFNIQEALHRIRRSTEHLAGLKIAVMGCIVNGPGEMADADYGYVGSGPGKVTLYKKHNVVKRNVDEAEAVDELVKLIKESGDWKEK